MVFLYFQLIKKLIECAWGSSSNVSRIEEEKAVHRVRGLTCCGGEGVKVGWEVGALAGDRDRLDKEGSRGEGGMLFLIGLSMDRILELGAWQTGVQGDSKLLV